MQLERIRFPVKLTFALLAALLVGFHFNLETPRWAVMTAGIVAGGTAFAAGGDPYSGALRHRGMLRIIGTFLGCLAALVIMIATIRAPVVVLSRCCSSSIACSSFAFRMVIRMRWIKSGATWCVAPRPLTACAAS